MAARRLGFWTAIGALLAGGLARAETAPVAPLPSAGEGGQEEQEGEGEGGVDSGNDSAGYTPPVEAGRGPSALSLNGYVDVGFAHAQGNGTSFAPGDNRVPADYGVDTFAPAVNSRGDVASTDAGQVFVNGFLPRSAGIGGRPSFLLNTLALDFRYDAPAAPLMFFSRVHFLPRFSGTEDEARVFVEQAFGRLTPFDSQELAIHVGKFDSVFGIEYLENQSNIRTGITPSLIARYTTGQSVGAKLFYRIQIAPLWSAISLNLAATNSGNFVESLQPPDASLTGRPVGSGRLGYELNAPVFQAKLGVSGMYGPRNDQPDPNATQRAVGADARLSFPWVYLNGEYVRIDQEEGTGPKTTSLGTFPFASGFHARGGYAQLAVAPPLSAGFLRRVTVYGRYDRREAWFEGFTHLTVDRITAGLRLDLWESLILKGEWLRNRELRGAPTVDNDVVTSSVVFSW